MLPAFEKSAAVVVEEGGLTSHAAVVGINLGISVIVGAKDATSLVKTVKSLLLILVKVLYITAKQQHINS